MAATGNYKVLPPFDEKTSYESWKNEIAIWRLVTELDEKKQALPVSLLLKGRAKAIALEIDAGDLNSETGVTALMTKLDLVFLRLTLSPTGSLGEAVLQWWITSSSLNIATTTSVSLKWNFRMQC